MTDIELIIKVVEKIMSTNTLRNIVAELPADWNKDLICLNLRFDKGRLFDLEAY